MAAKNLVVAALLLVVAVGRVPHCAQAATTATVNMAANVLISGIVPCSVGSSINMAAVPAFPNAAVQLVCGGSVVASATADGTGAFVINLGNLLNQNLLAALLGNQCNVVVNTPLAACNVSLAGATGTLTAPLQLVGTGTGGLLGGTTTIVGHVIKIVGGILSLVPGLFSTI